MKWKKVSEHPLPDGRGDKIFILKRFLEGEYSYGFATHPSDCMDTLVVEWCEFYPDEIDSSDSASSIHGNQSDRPKSATQIDESEPSWEEKFWEERRFDVYKDLLHKVEKDRSVFSEIKKDLESDLFIKVARQANQIISELKRGIE